MDKIKHEGIGGTCARFETSQDADNADNADQKVKWFLKEEDLSSKTGRQFYLGKRVSKI